MFACQSVSGFPATSNAALKKHTEDQFMNDYVDHWESYGIQWSDWVDDWHDLYGEYDGKSDKGLRHYDGEDWYDSYSYDSYDSYDVFDIVVCRIVEGKTRRGAN